MSDPNAEPQTISETRHKARRLAVDLGKLTGRAYIDRIESGLMEAEERRRREENEACATIVNRHFHDCEDTACWCPVAMAKEIRARLEEK